MFASEENLLLFDNLVGSPKQVRRNCDAQRVCGLLICGEPHARRKFYWQVARRRTAQNFDRKICSAPVTPAKINTVAD
jgi:hypothetical protein